jgi:hypothetical protein
MTSAEQPSPRISPFVYPKEYVLPARPSAAGQAVADAHRQTGFLLAGDVALFEQGMNLELRIVADSRAAQYRTPALAALLGLWSRSFAYRADVCLLATRGSYVSCLPLLRAAADCVGAQRGLASDGCQEFIDWLATAFGQDREHAALEIGLGRYRSGAILAADERLGQAYRAVTELTMTHFGATLLQTAPEASQEKVTIAFGESGFHLGWAQLIFGWLLTLTDAQLEASAGARDVLAVSGDVEVEARRFSEAVAGALAREDRCRLEEVDNARFLISNFRCLAGAVPRRILL